MIAIILNHSSICLSVLIPDDFFVCPAAIQVWSPKKQLFAPKTMCSTP
jgi:hypothetical protein